MTEIPSPPSRDRLLREAAILFGERGFAATTTRDIAERAGVDAALIVRHFGSKVGLYIETLRFGDEAPPASLLDTDRMLGMLRRLDVGGPGPIFQAALHTQSDEAVRDATRSALRERVVEPLRRHFATDGADRAQLRAELVAAAFAGIALGRSSGAFTTLAEVPPKDIVALVQAAFGP